MAEPISGGEPSQPEKEPEEAEILQTLTPKTYGLGVKLEQMVADIHRNMGYSVETRRRIRGNSGAISEIDVIAIRGARTRAIECKNYDPSKTIGSALLRVFADKLRDTGIYDGLFVTNAEFSSDAAQIADHRGIEYWDGQDLYQRWYSHQLGRTPSPRQELVLPLRQSFSEASTLRLRNSVVVNLFDRVLFHHTYYMISYRLRSVRSDPKGKHHKVTDEGTTIVDALDGHIVNIERGLLSVVGGFFKSSEQRLASKIDNLVANDLLSMQPVIEAIAESSDYKVRVSEPSVSLGDAIRIVKFYVIEKNTEEVNYEVRVRGESETRSMKIVPRMNEITIRSQKTVYVPIWELDYEAGRRSFERRSVASSGATIKDDLLRCGRCTLLKGQNVAVCEACGQPLCEKHALQEEQRWLCEDHVSNSLRQEIKANKLTSKALGKLRGLGARLTGHPQEPE